MILNHDAGKIGAWPVRDYRCTSCDQLHRYKRAWASIPQGCSVCGGPLRRDWSDGGLPAVQVKTERREVRFRLEDEVHQGKRPRAIEQEEHSIATL